MPEKLQNFSRMPIKKPAKQHKKNALIYLYVMYEGVLVSCAEYTADNDADISADRIAEGTDEHCGPDELGPSLRDCKSRCRRRSADVRVRCNEDILEREIQQFSADETKEHIDNNHDEAEDEEHGGIRQDLHDGRGDADDEEEHVDKERADLLRPVHRIRLFLKNAGKDHGDKRNPDVLAAEKGSAHL